MEPAVREPVNGWLHLSGAVLAAVGVVVLGAQTFPRAGLGPSVAVAVFGLSAVLMFGASALYHMARTSRHGTLFRRLDHSMIYVVIAGSYTPVCLIALRGMRLGVGLLIAVWSLAVLGVVQKTLWLNAPRRLSTALYLGMGWLGALTVPALRRTVPTPFAVWLLVGGVLYTVGAIFYMARWPRGRPGVFGHHELWHVFVLLASASHYWAVLAYLVPSA